MEHINPGLNNLDRNIAEVLYFLCHSRCRILICIVDQLFLIIHFKDVCPVALEIFRNNF